MSTTKKGAAVQGTPAPSQKPELSNLSVIPKTETKTEEKPAEKPVLENLEKVISIEDRKKNFVMFEKLLDKHSKLNETKFKLDSFMIGADENNQTLRIDDINGLSFRTGNPTLLKDVIDLIKKQVYESCEAAEGEVLKFKI
jgi:hypothetical protein